MRFILDLDDGDDGERVAGRLIGEDGRPTSFAGWLDLARVLEDCTRQRRDHQQGAT